MNAAMTDQGQFAGAAGVDHLPFEAREGDDHPRGDVPAAVATNMQPAPALAHVPSRSLLRRFGYGRAQMAEIAEKDATAPSHRRKRVTRLVKKEDRMLVFFWIPALIRTCLIFKFRLLDLRSGGANLIYSTVAVAWALYTAYPALLKMLQQFAPLKEGVLRLTAQ